jgi:hypothetical protein
MLAVGAAWAIMKPLMKMLIAGIMVVVLTVVTGCQKKETLPPDVPPVNTNAVPPVVP